jgi:hypothetical protein
LAPFLRSVRLGSAVLPRGRLTRCYRGAVKRALPFVLIAAMLVLPALSASGALTPLNDLLSLGQGGGQEPAAVSIVKRAEPPFVATPRAKCETGSRREPGIQGRVPQGAGDKGFHCNVDLVSHQGTSGGFKVFRYIDPKGHECAFYDTALLYPVNAFKLDGTSQGVAVLDMSNPSRPVQTATLTELPMLSPHESLNLNPKRGLLAAVLGNPSTYPGLVSIYDVRSDCRHPKLQSTELVARLGHESGFSPDGKTFYAAGTAYKSISAIDVTNPKEPHAVWQGNVVSHGLTLSGDGNRAYIADPGGDMLILDTSEIQARKPNPQAREISRLTWRSASIPQNAIPFTVKGKPYILEFDEYTAGTTGGGNKDDVGAGRIIDISNERAPKVIANLRLQVNQPADHKAAANDPGAFSPVQGYAAHYCNIPTQVDPKVVACSFITSGLRVFDISELTKPKEIAYYVAPTKPRAENSFMASDFAMSKPAFAPERREIWYSDGATGFNVVRVAKDVWPASGSAGKGCLAKRSPIGPRNIGRVRLGLTRRQLARRVPAPRKRTKRSWRWCVKGGKGTVSAAFSRRGRVALVTSTSKRYGNRHVFPGSKRSKLTRAFRRRTSVGRAIVRANHTSPRFFGVRKGKVRYVGVTYRRTLAKRKTLRAYLRYAGVAK